MKFILIACVLAACGYDVTLADCTILCSGSADTSCPSGFSCGAEGLCRSAGSTTACAVATCNTPNDLGAVTPLEPFAGTTRVAATASPGRLIVTYGTAAGLTAVVVDLSAPTGHGPEIVIASSIASNIHGVAVTDRVFFTGTPNSGGGTALALVDPQLDPLVSPRVEQDVDVGAPENSSARDGGGLLVAGATGDTAQIVALDQDGMNPVGASYQLASAAGGSVVALGGDRYLGGWYSLAATCIVRVFDGGLATTAMFDLTETCSSIRIASNGSRVGMAWPGSGGIRATTSDMMLSTPTATVTLIATASNSPRIAATTDGFWAIVPESPGIQAALLTPAGEVGATVSLTPYDGSLFPYDVVADDGVAYAVWTSPATSPHLYIERLCP